MISFDKVESAVRNLAEQFPEAVYEKPAAEVPTKCSYVTGECRHGAGEGCIFGQALRDVGVDRNVLARFEQESGGDTSLDNLLAYLGIEYDDADMDWAKNVQHKQDTGWNWRAAVGFADAWADWRAHG